MNKILVAYDGSDSARRALDEAASLARRGDTVTIVGGAEVLPAVGRAAPMLVPVEHEERQRELADASSLTTAPQGRKP